MEHAELRQPPASRSRHRTPHALAYSPLLRFTTSVITAKRRNQRVVSRARVDCLLFSPLSVFDFVTSCYAACALCDLFPDAVPDCMESNDSLKNSKGSVCSPVSGIIVKLRWRAWEKHERICQNRWNRGRDLNTRSTRYEPGMRDNNSAAKCAMLQL
jgi:hypothetical protein